MEFCGYPLAWSRIAILLPTSTGRWQRPGTLEASGRDARRCPDASAWGRAQEAATFGFPAICIASSPNPRAKLASSFFLRAECFRGIGLLSAAADAGDLATCRRGESAGHVEVSALERSFSTEWICPYRQWRRHDQPEHVSLQSISANGHCCNVLADPRNKSRKH